MDISVYMPVYNGADFIKRCLDSVLSQEFNGTFEFVIVDDGSEDNTVKLIKEYNDDRIKLFECEHKGIVEASNYGLDQCSGKYIARIDVDDVMLPNSLQLRYNFLEENPEYGMCHCGCIIDYGCISYPHMYKEYEITLMNLLANTTMIHSCIMYKRDLNLRYEKEYEWAEDMRFYLEASNSGVRIYNIKDILVKKHIHSKSIGSSKQAIVFRQYVKAKKQYFKRFNGKHKKITLKGDNTTL